MSDGSKICDGITVSIKSNTLGYGGESCYTKIQKLICKLYIEQNSAPDISLLEVVNVDYRDRTEPEVIYRIPEHKTITIKYGNVSDKADESNIQCRWYKISKDHGCGPIIDHLYQLDLTAQSKTIINKFILEATKIKEEKQSLNIYHYSLKHACWDNFGKVQRRDESTIIIKKEDKDKLIEDISEFVKSEDEYDAHGIMYKRNYLFYGKPGTGKTSLANVIANKYNRNIYIMSFDSRMENSDLYNSIEDIDGNSSILLLEDIDCIYVDRQNATNNSNISFSALLNVLDGVVRSKGLITIITSNHIGKLDPALLRPGRIDMMIEFTAINREQFIGFLNFYKIKLDSDVIAELMDISRKHELVPAVFSSFMFRHRNKLLDSSNYVSLFELYLKEIEPTIEKKILGSYS